MDEADTAHRFAEGQNLHVETLDWPAVYELSVTLVQKILGDSFQPDLILAIYDPQASGGYAVGAQLASLLQLKGITVPVELLRIEGRRGKRHVSEVPEFQGKATKILVVDDVSWSGNTLRLAREALRARTAAEVRSCALIVGGPAIDTGAADYHGRRSSARDARFPWGLVTPTAEFRQYFNIEETTNREVCWSPRPWGYWEQFALNEVCTVRILTILPGEYLSLQYHEHRDEFFIALDDGVVLQIGDKKLTAKRGDYVLIPRLTRHRQFAPTDRPVRVLEISFGHYDQVGDIVRLEDKYGREEMDGSV